MRLGYNGKRLNLLCNNSNKLKISKRKTLKSLRVVIIAVFRNVIVYQYRSRFLTNKRLLDFDFLKRSDRK